MKKQRHTFMVALLLPISAIPVQYAIPGLMVETFTASLSVLFILLTIQNVNELIDGQTGLYGFEAFIMFLRQYLNEKTKFSLLIVYSRDMANFQGLFNTDIYTQAVQKYAEWLTDAVGRKNLVFVIDDGLFGVLSGNNWDESWAGLLSMNILNRSKEIWDFGAVQIKMPVRIGVFRFPDNNYSGVPEIMDLIDQLTDAPGHLGDRHIVFSTDFIPGKLQRETSIGSTLKRNIEQESLELSYQPIYSTSSKRFTALETLIKVTLQNGEIVRQSEVLRIAKNMGLSQRLGELILAKACKWYIQNDIAAKGIDHLHIRLLEAQCAELDWHDNVLKIVRDQGMEFERLYLAITEPSIVNTIKNLKPSMQQLASLGIRFALDDYGSGYTDLSQLLDIPLSLIKIDKKIVWSGLSNWKGRKLLSGSISMFNILGKKLVAEGIETREQAEMLTSIGCEFLQGYYYAKPENRETIISMLT